ncbi:MAG: prepilin-type N-terminal cleavage/methylation domain-containing protein [Longimicrobiales bacterium]|nr:prepilin-type N-terminal cleavage/methylation domain-containing protein [Longimicrobiales bacterium]
MSTPAPAPSGPRAGFTLVEVMVALVILAVGILGLAATTMYAVRQTTFGEITTERSAALQSVLERLRAMEFDSVRSGTDSVGTFQVNWRVVEASRTKIVEVVTLGPGLASAPGAPPSLAPSVADTFVYRIHRP